MREGGLTPVAVPPGGWIGLSAVATALAFALVEWEWRKSTSATIGAGTLEIQKEQISVRGLGIPR